MGNDVVSPGTRGGTAGGGWWRCGYRGLLAQLREMVAAGVGPLTLALAGVQMADSAGIGLLISAHNSLNKAGGELTVIHPWKASAKRSLA